MEKNKIYISLLFIILIIASSFSLGPKVTSQQPVDSSKDPAVVKTDTIAKTQNNLQIDTAINKTPQQTILPVDTTKKIDSSLINPVSENTLTNTKLFIYILLTVLGLALFFYIFVISLFKTFHKKKSTRQSLLLSWNLFFIVTIIWIFIVWGLVAGFWTTSSFMIVVIFLFIISLIMTIIAIKSK